MHVLDQAGSGFRPRAGTTSIKWKKRHGNIFLFDRRGREVELEAGVGKEDVYVIADKLRRPDVVWVISVDTGLPFVAADEFHLDEARRHGDEVVAPAAGVAFQEHQVENSLGEGAEDLDPIDLLERLSPYLT